MGLLANISSVCVSLRRRWVPFAPTSSTNLSAPPFLCCNRPLLENDFAAHHRERGEDACEAFKRSPATLAPHQTGRYNFLILKINEYEICVESFSYCSFALQVKSLSWCCARQVDKTSETNSIQLREQQRKKSLDTWNPRRGVWHFFVRN